MPSLESVLAGIPFMGGYAAKSRFNEQSSANELQQAGALQQILAQQQAAQEGEQLKGVLAQAGGDPARAVEALLRAGTPKSVALAAQLKGMLPKPAEPYTLGNQRRGPNNELLAEAPFKPDAPPKPDAAPEIVRLQDAAKQYPEGHPLRDQLNARIKMLGERAPQTQAGPRAPVGFQFNADGTTLEPIPGGPKDPLKINLAGGRESVYVQRMMMGANQAAKDLHNVVQLPLTASTGILGGRRQGAGLLDAGKEVLANKATGQEAQAYNAMATGFQRSLAQIESAGLMPSGSLTHQMDAVLFKEGDTNMTKLHKLAQTRQIVEAGMEVIEANPRVSPEEKAKVKTVLDSIRKSVPFTHSDLIRLQVEQETNPKATLKSLSSNKSKADDFFK